jgi:hypothetical protein
MYGFIVLGESVSFSGKKGEERMKRNNNKKGNEKL